MEKFSVIWTCNGCCHLVPKEGQDDKMYCQIEQVEVPRSEYEVNKEPLYNLPRECPAKRFILFDPEHLTCTKAYPYELFQRKIREKYGKDVKIEFVEDPDPDTRPTVTCVRNDEETGTAEYEINMPLTMAHFHDIMGWPSLTVDIESMKDKVKEACLDKLQHDPKIRKWIKNGKKAMRKAVHSPLHKNKPPEKKNQEEPITFTVPADPYEVAVIRAWAKDIEERFCLAGKSQIINDVRDPNDIRTAVIEYDEHGIPIIRSIRIQESSTESEDAVTTTKITTEIISKKK